MNKQYQRRNYWTLVKTMGYIPIGIQSHRGFPLYEEDPDMMTHPKI
jgi:hypothetical protein